MSTAHELRRDPLLGRWSAIRRESLPPEAYTRPAQPSAPEGAACPLCDACANNSGEPFAIDNPYAVFESQASLGRKGHGMFDIMEAAGTEKLVVECRAHAAAPEDLGAGHYARVIAVLAALYREAEQGERTRHVLIGKSAGPGAGSPTGHAHSRVVGLPVIPSKIKAELDGAREYFVHKDRCAYCDVINAEESEAVRVLHSGPGTVAFCPFFSHSPFECWVMPKRHSCSFGEITETEITELGGVMAGLAKRLRAVLGGAGYTYILHTAPVRVPKKTVWHTLGEDYHWHLELAPVLASPPGVIWGPALGVVTTSPEDAARHIGKI